MPTSAHHLEWVAIEVAEQAAALVRAASGDAAATRTKSTPTDVVTDTDVESESLIRRELSDRCPGSTIVGEELGEGIGSNHIRWIVDPIDGTVNFLYDLPVVAISIAAAIGDRIVAGAVADVHRQEIFSASFGAGARRNGKEISTSAIDQLEQSLIGTGFAYDARLRAEHATVVASVVSRCRDIRCMGSAALNLCWVGCGRLDGYFERDLKVYDHAAGALIAAEAGAVVWPPDDDDLIVAGAPGVGEQLRDLVTANR